MYTLTATLSVGLALLGPGVWSADARLFGWRRIDIRAREVSCLIEPQRPVVLVARA